MLKYFLTLQSGAGLIPAPITDSIYRTFFTFTQLLFSLLWFTELFLHLHNFYSCSHNLPNFYTTFTDHLRFTELLFTFTELLLFPQFTELFYIYRTFTQLLLLLPRFTELLHNFYSHSHDLPNFYTTFMLFQILILIDWKIFFSGVFYLILWKIRKKKKKNN